MKFANEHLDAIHKLIDQSPISRLEMRENIIDHLACAVEYKMMNGFEFEPALESSLVEFAPNGLKEIEHETYLLLNANSINMKKVTYALGLIFSMIACGGIFFRMLHWPGATELITLGFGGLVAVFIPLLSFTRKTADKTTYELIRERVFMASLALLSLGAVFKTLHYTGANEFLLLGMSGFTFVYLPITFLKLYREAIAS